MGQLFAPWAFGSKKCVVLTFGLNRRYGQPDTFFFLAQRIGLYSFCFFFCVFSAPFLGRALFQGGISARNICSFRADLLPLLLAKMCQLFLFLFCPLDFCSICGFCSLYAPDTTFSALCTALVALVFTAFTTSRFMCWVFRCHCVYLYEAYIYFVFCLYDIMIRQQHHILCRFLEVGPYPPAQTVGTCPVNRAPKTITSYN